MQVSLRWLKEFVDISLGVEELAHQLTMLGLEIEKVERPGAGVKNVFVGKILDIAPHPDADKLVVCQTDIGKEAPLQIVCGAKNMKPGDLVPTAIVGATLPGGFEIGRRKMRGIESQGMMCSTRELGLGSDHDGLMILPPDTPIGADAIALLGIDDAIFEIEVTPNRGDWAGMIGVARELAAYFTTPLRMPDSNVVENGPDVASCASVDIEAPDLCSRYVARVAASVKSLATPTWMAQRLLQAGQRLVNPVVDITNYILLETGHPLHAFDLDKLAGQRIIVRKARAGETIKTIDGELRELTGDMLVIADEKAPVAIAGVMGGLDSEVGESTTRILLESAWFQPSSIRKTARALTMNTEASQRFQRGADPEMAVYACNRAARLIHEICGASISTGLIDVFPVQPKPIEISLRYARTNSLLGTSIAPEEQKNILERLDFTISTSTDQNCSVRVPSWRHDATREADLIEEIARLYGYDRIPATVPRVRKSESVFAPHEIESRRLRRHLVSLGLTEMMNLTFSSAQEMQHAGLTNESRHMVLLQNPLSENSSAMRASLVPALLNAASLNYRRGTKRVHAFELGHVYLPVANESLPKEEARLGIVLTGLRQEEHWARESQMVDLFDCKGIVESICDFFRISCSFEAHHSDLFAEGHCAAITVDGNTAGWMGKITSDILERFDIAQDVYIAEILLEQFLNRKSEPAVFTPLSTFPPSLRDMAVLVDSQVTASSVLTTAKAAGGKFLQDVRLFDVYSGKQVPAGKKSMALNLVFQSNERTLTDKDTQKAWDQILKALTEKCGATLR